MIEMHSAEWVSERDREREKHTHADIDPWGQITLQPAGRLLFPRAFHLCVCVRVREKESTSR